MFDRTKLALRNFLSGGKTVSRIEDVFGGMLAGIELSELRNYESYLRAGSKKVWATWKACDLVAKVVLDTPTVLRRVGGDGKPVINREITKLLTTPNPFDSFGEMTYKTVMHLKLTGNAFWAKDQPNAKGDRPKQLFLLNPKRIKIVTDPRLGVTGYTYQPNQGLEIPFETFEIMHFRLPHPDNEFWGLGEIESGEDLFQDYINHQTWKAKFWKNGASPSGILICEDQITDQVKFDEAKAKWHKEYGGAANSGKTAWLTGKWRHEQLGLSAQEMQDIEKEKWSVEQIFMQHGVPLSVAGVREAANYATAQIDDLRFRRYAVKPLCKFISDTITADLVQGFDQTLELIYAVSGLTDIANVTTNYVPLFDRGALSLNELRELAGMQKKDDPLFDLHYINSSLVPLELAGLPAQTTGQQAQAAAILERHTRRLLEFGVTN
jgi:HK97 family phage portal protein